MCVCECVYIFVCVCMCIVINNCFHYIARYILEAPMTNYIDS